MKLPVCIPHLFWQLYIMQDDQIGQIFAFWAIVFVGQICENNSSSPNFRAMNFSTEKIMH
jgi:hypothetical protein